eukprot:3949552-Pyramimonas_sp.AAC.1
MRQAVEQQSSGAHGEPRRGAPVLRRRHELPPPGGEFVRLSDEFAAPVCRRRRSSGARGTRPRRSDSTLVL